jgi:hypothetical protein
MFFTFFFVRNAVNISKDRICEGIQFFIELKNLRTKKNASLIKIAGRFQFYFDTFRQIVKNNPICLMPKRERVDFSAFAR